MDRFWSKIDIKEVNECWPWMGTINYKGYGRTTHDGKTEGTHRCSWRLANGEIPSEMWVLHHCDNRRCCNPAHLFLGTPADNTADMMAKGRHRVPSGADHYSKTRPETVLRGDRHPRAKLREWQIPYIRALVNSGASHRDIARAYGVNASQITRIARGNSWSHAKGGDNG